MTNSDFQEKKRRKEKLTMVTCYDSCFAKMLADTSVDALLVGDSLAMVVHGHESTLQATQDMMALHTSAVKRGAPKKFIVADMPFLSFRKGLVPAMNCVEALMQAGANAVKLENIEGHEEIVRHIVQSGVPVMGHLGLTPQSLHQMGGYRVQGKSSSDALKIVEGAERLQDLGCFSLVLECVPDGLATELSESLRIPTIGIGAGSNTDGQILVLHDLLGFQTEMTPKFLRHFLDGKKRCLDSIENYCRAVREKSFPNEKETYL